MGGGKGGVDIVETRTIYYNIDDIINYRDR